MQNNMQQLNNKIDVLIKILPILAFIIPFLILYFFQNTTGLYFSFEMTWKGRTFYLFFLWIAALELILFGEKLQPRVSKLYSARTVAFILALLLPTIYIVASNYYAFPSKAIVDWAYQNGIRDQPDWIPLDVEYLVLAVFSALIIWLEYGGNGLKKLMISPIFLAAIGTIYTIDNVYRYGSFTPFQIFVPTTAMLAARILNLMGYQTRLILGDNMPILYATNQSGISWGASIAWPCSGVESLIIYTLIILLFLRITVPSWKQRIIYFAVGAIITYLINVLRIVTIFVIAVNGGNWAQFHDYYGQLYSIMWIVSYPLIIIGSRALWRKIRSRKPIVAENQGLPNQDKPSQNAPSIPLAYFNFFCQTLFNQNPGVFNRQ